MRGVKDGWQNPEAARGALPLDIFIRVGAASRGGPEYRPMMSAPRQAAPCTPGVFYHPPDCYGRESGQTAGEGSRQGSGTDPDRARIRHGHVGHRPGPGISASVPNLSIGQAKSGPGVLALQRPIPERAPPALAEPDGLHLLRCLPHVTANPKALPPAGPQRSRHIRQARSAGHYGNGV